jgi:HdeA/HdeB family
MNIRNLLLHAAAIVVAAPAYAQVELKTYADQDGYLDVQTLTCAQLANTFQEDADYLTAWYSGWYNGLGKKHMMKVDRAKSLEHELIVYCKANQGKKVIQAIDVVFKAYRAEKGIKMKE